MNILEKYEHLIEFFSNETSKAEKKIRLISTLRLWVALLAILTFYFALTSNQLLFYVLLIELILFTILVNVHSTWFRKKELLKNHLRINKEEKEYLEGNYTSFPEGNQFINHSHPYSFDFDLFGEESLYQSISRTVTYRGNILLAESLLYTKDQESIINRQSSVRELSSKLELRQKFRATGLLVDENPGDRIKLMNWLETPYHFTISKILPYLLIILPLLALTGLGLSIYESKIHPILIAAVLINWTYIGINGKKITLLFSLISKKKLLLENYSELLTIANDETFKSTELTNLQTSFNNASIQLKRLAKYVGWFDQRLNILVIPILNSLFLFDLQCSYQIEKWRKENDKDVLKWLEGLGTLDAICSLSNFSYNNPDFIFPEISSSTLSLKSEGLAHPLIKLRNRVPNDFEIGNQYQIAIITGANMAGKSTFLRTVGINAVLAYAGAPVCAKSFSISLMELISSMRISDSLKDHTSYFYAELQRLKTIKEKAEAGKPLLIMLDEMLKGTNSKDKQQGSKAFVEGLLQYPCLGFVATHDLLLGQLEDEHPGKIKNYCFESFVTDNELTFDYKIRSGVAQNTNASFLMKDLGII